ncbi:hypothetical protein EJ03DRAFT_385973 [Teratosphaeria nubilosa]|uniref:Uncharacterized protein n=1 Tax=Teratosphaeria nubilosa TaxID=161662 RepID=A0A6G1KUV1_9PEZI|nr:hypothetical protein EJ03DRAFT_385973 [Teratosphaeria nubilosa]
MSCRKTTREDLAPMPRMDTYHQAHWTPGDEQVKPFRSLRPRPAPINVADCETSPTLDVASVTQPASKLCDRESPKDPEIVDVAASQTWPRRGTVVKRTPSSRTGTPSLYSRCSTRQSELSYGILDYYAYDCPSGYDASSLPLTPKIDPAAMNRFNFDPVPQTPTTETEPTQLAEPADSNTTSGAERTDQLVDIVPPSVVRKLPHNQHKHSYSLFPRVEQTPPQNTRPRALTLDRTSPTSMYSRPNALSRMPPHIQPMPSYRPRKESPTPSRSRWSEDTIASPELVSTTGPPRTSFGSLLFTAGQTDDKDGSNASQYPACFFEDDDESQPIDFHPQMRVMNVDDPA